MTAAAASLELNFTALTSTAATVDLALESNAGITLNTAGGDDVITMSISSVGDTITTGAGADGITAAIAQLTASDTVDGGAGTDTLTFSDAGSSADSDYTNVSNIEALTLANGTNTIVLGAEYAGTGSVTITGGTGADAITLGSGVTTAQTVALATAGNDTVVATGATGVITVTMDDADLTANDTLTGGSASDILTITGTGNQVTSAEMIAVTGFENIKVASNAAFDMLLHDNNTVSGVITVDAALATSAGVTFSAAAENDGTIVYTGGGGIDTVIGTDTTATGDTIGGGAGADIITGGKGGDIITGGAGADVFTYLAAADSTGTAQDSITDFTSGTDFISVTINNSTNTTGQTYDATIQTAAAGTLAVQAGMSGQIGQTFYDTTNSALVVNAGGDNLVTTLDYQIGVNAAATAANTVAAGDVRYVITGGTGVDNITTGSGADTIDGGAGNDVIIGGAGNDTITAGTGIDTITAGLGLDSIVLGAAGDVDTVIMTTGGAIEEDTVSGFIVAGGEDELQVDLSDLNALDSGTFQLSDGTAVLAAGATNTLTVTALGSAAGDYGAAASSLVAITAAAAYTVTSLETAIEGNGTAAGLTAGDSFLIIYDDTTNSYLAKVTDNAGTANGSTFTDITITNLMEFTGVAAAESFLTTSFAIIA
jgi:Ca2+-binding RTX toxin-like protein